MPRLQVRNIHLYYEEAGSGTPVVFAHEFAGDWRSWEAQVRFFSSRYRAITFSARGYLPSDVPDSPDEYSQENQIEDLKGLLDGLKIEKAHLCGLSMGSYTSLFFGIRYPERCLSLTIAGSGYGSGASREAFHKQIDEHAGRMLTKGMKSLSGEYLASPTRVQLQNKNPRAWEEMRQQWEEHSAKGSAYTFLGVQRKRASITELGDSLRKMALPVLIMSGDEDEPGLEGSFFMKRNIPRAGLEVFPRSGHALNLEEPEHFNRSLLDFITAVDAGHWEARDPRSL